MAEKHTAEKNDTPPALPAAPWEDLYEGVSRLKVSGGHIYDIKVKGLCFVPGA